MKSIGANLTRVETEERRDDWRWHVELLVTVGPQGRGRHATVRNLSEGGMLLETDTDLRVGDCIHVQLPGAHSTEARVVWNRDQAYGCEFLTRIPISVVSGALLQAPPDVANGAGDGPQFEEFPIGIRPTVDELARWKADFERTNADDNLRLVAFRQTETGLLIAIVGLSLKS